MEVLSFQISGRYAFFKNPEYNVKKQYTYEHIHKPVVLGLLGAIMGFDGRGQVNKHGGKLEYYEKLKDIKISIIPAKVKFNKHIQTYNNSTGYANNGDCYNMSREILENVKWTIVILKDSVQKDIFEELKNRLIEGRAKYPVYLGVKDCTVKIDNVKEFKVTEVLNVDDIYKIDSFYDSSIIVEEDDESFNEEKPYSYKLMLPTAIVGTLYKMSYVNFNNTMITVNCADNIYMDGDRYYYFM